jgi:uncharacterized membrane protein
VVRSNVPPAPGSVLDRLPMSTPHHEHDLTEPLARATAMAAAALAGLGAIFWIAANWDTLGRLGQFALVEAAMVLSGLAAVWRARWRAPLTMLLLLLTGGLLANVGQTYQTGADPWQLFTWWALLGLPLAWWARHDAVWSSWAVVHMTALSLWAHTSAGSVWFSHRPDTLLQLAAWALSLLMVAGFSARARPWTGAGLWSWRLALTLSAMAITSAAMASLFSSGGSPLFLLGLLVLVSGAWLMSQSQHFDLYGLSTVALCLNVLLVLGAAKMLLKGASGDALAAWLILGLLAAGLLGGTVKWILQLARHNGGAA